MRYLGLILVLAMWITAGCASTDDAPPWQRPGLANGKIVQTLAKAAKDNDDQMTMSSDRDLMTSDLAKKHGD